MRILDKYIIIQYLKIFFIITIAFSAVFIIIDVFDRLPRLMRSSSEINYLAMFFLLRIPYLFLITSPVTVLLSGLFLMDNLSKYNESIAIRAAGISILRMVTPILVLGLIFSFGVMLLGDLVLPRAEEYRDYILRVKIRDSDVDDIRMRSNIVFRDEGYSMYNIGFFDGFNNVLRTVIITHIDPDNLLVRKKIIAAEAEWDSQEWIFKNCYVRSFHQGKLERVDFYQEKVFAEINLKPDDFIKLTRNTLSMNFIELKEYISRLQRIGEKHHSELVDLYTKISFPFSNFIILLFCIPLASASNRNKYRGMIFLIGILICFIYLTILRISQSFGYNEVLDPLIAAWLPNIVFTVIGIFFVIKAEV